MRPEHWLRPLEVRVARNDDVAARLRGKDEGFLQFEQLLVDVVERAARPKLDVGDDLIVPASSRVQLAADVAELFDQASLDVRVYVFERNRIRHLAAFDLTFDRAEGLNDAFRFAGREDADLGQHARM